jgi:hypothetical protein
VNSKTILAQHPVPWTHSVDPFGTGEVKVHDAAGNVVPLFTLIDFAKDITASIALRQAAAQASPSA